MLASSRTQVKAQAERKKQELEEAAEQAAKDEEEAKSSVLTGYRARVDEAKAKLLPEPAGKSVVGRWVGGTEIDRKRRGREQVRSEADGPSKRKGEELAA
jgi:hypothetical protein